MCKQVVDKDGQTFVEQLERPGSEVEELMKLHVEREGGSPRRRRRPADGEVGAVAEVGAQRLEIRAQMRRAQALTCIMAWTKKTILPISEWSANTLTQWDGFPLGNASVHVEWPHKSPL